MIPKFYATIDRGEYKLENPKKFKIYLTSLQQKDKPTRIEIVVKRYRKKRSGNQNAYYWLCINLISQELGYEPDELHAAFKSMFLTDRSGKLPIIKSTTRLDSKEFTDYIDKIANKMAEFDIILPNPEDVYF